MTNYKEFRWKIIKKRVVVETITLSIDTTSNKSNCKNRYSCAINRFGSLFIYTFAVSCKSADGQTDREKYIRTHSIETFKKPTIEDHNNYSNKTNKISQNRIVSNEPAAENQTTLSLYNRSHVAQHQLNTSDESD